MKHKLIICISALCLGLVGNVQAQNKKMYRNGWIDFNKNGVKDIYEDPSQPVEKRVADLLSQMSVEEKTCQLATLYGYGRVLKDSLPVAGWKNEIWKDGIANIDEMLNGVGKKSALVPDLLYPFSNHAEAVNTVQRWFVEETRLGIPVDFTNEGIHGLNHTKATPLPAPIAIGSTWNKELVRRAGVIAGQEAKALGYTNVYAPILDIVRDPRWGRVSEGSGEDPFLGGAIAKAMVYGYQGANLSDQLKRNDEILACVKHFALYGAGEAGRDYNTVDMSRNRMFNEYMYPYEAAVEAGVGSVMASFNEIDGVPATANKWLMTDVLRKQWGFNGFVVTDFTGISEMTEHGIGDLQAVSARALNAGVDMDMVSEGFVGTLKKSVMSGKVSMKTLDTACRRILEAKYKLGLFDNPYKYCDPERPARDIFTKEHRAAARRIAAESFVLLKNDSIGLHPGSLPQPLLPLKKEGTVAVIGPLGNTRSNMPGTWSVAARLNDYPSLYEGLKEMMSGKVNVTYAKGSNLIGDAAYEERATMFGRSLNRDNHTDKELLDEALKTAAGADVIIAALGESSEMSGESSSRTNLDLPDVQRSLLEALLKTGKPVVLTLFTGRPLTPTWEQANVTAIRNVWFGGSEAAYAIGDVLFGDVNPSGKLTMTFPKNVGQIPLFYNHKNTGRPLQAGKWFEKFRSNYLDVDNEPLYPFGYGLSYTTFRYSDIALSTPSMGQDGSITAAVTVTNTGKRDGAEVVQLYIRDLVGSITRPVRELKGFEKIFLRAGESKTVSFKITPELLRFYDYDLNHVAEPGDFDLFIGGSSQAARTARITLK